MASELDACLSSERWIKMLRRYAKNEGMGGKVGHCASAHGCTRLRASLTREPLRSPRQFQVDFLAMVVRFRSMPTPAERVEKCVRRCVAGAACRLPPAAATRHS